MGERSAHRHGPPDLAEKPHLDTWVLGRSTSVHVIGQVWHTCTYIQTVVTRGTNRLLTTGFVHAGLFCNLHSPSFPQSSLSLSLSPTHRDCLFLSLTQTAGRWNLVVIAARSYLTNRTHCPFDTCVTHLPPIATPPSWPSCIAGT